MKKTVLFLLLISICSFTAAVSVGAVKARAETEDDSQRYLYTEIFSPDSLSEYFPQTSPTDVYVDAEYILISRQNGIFLLDKRTEEMKFLYLNALNDGVGTITVYQSSEIPTGTPSEDMAITKIYRSGNYILFLRSSNIFRIPLNFLDKYEYVKAIDNNAGGTSNIVIASTYFYVCGNILVSNDSSGFTKYIITENEQDFVCEKRTFAPTICTSFVYTSDNEFYYFRDNVLYKYNENAVHQQVVLDDYTIKYMVEYNGILYFTTTKGVFEYNLKTEASKARCIISANVNKYELGTLNSPKGLYIYGNSIYVADANTHSVSEFSLLTHEYTGNSYSVYDNAPNRVSKNAKQIYREGDKLYVLEQNNGITQISDINGTPVYKKYTFDYDGEYKSKCFAVYNGLALVTDGKDLMLFDFEKNTFLPINLDGNTGNITSLTVCDGKFYMLKTEFENLTPSAAIYVIDETNLTAEKTQMPQIDGTSKIFTADVFGKFYVIVDDTLYTVDSVNPQKPYEILYSIGDEILSVQTDFKGNVYALTANGMLEVDKISKTITYSDYLPKRANIKSFSLVYNSSDLYFLCDGFILKSSKDSIITSTPANITIPEELNFNLNKTIKTVNIIEDRKLFKVSLPDIENKGYFNYLPEKTGYTKSADQTAQYIVLCEVEGDYYLVTNGNYYIVRKSDVTDVTGTYTDSKIKKGYLSSAVYFYTYPVFADNYRTTRHAKHLEIFIESQFTYNGDKFYLVHTANGDTGYIPTSFLLEELAIEIPTVKIYTAYTINKNTKVYDENGNVIDNIRKRCKIDVLEKTDGMAYISYGNGKTGYIECDNIVLKGKNALRNTIVIILLAMSLTFSAIYLEVKQVTHKMNL